VPVAPADPLSASVETDRPFEISPRRRWEVWRSPQGQPAWARLVLLGIAAVAAFVMWGTWLLTFGLVFSMMSSIPHTAYMSSLAPPLAALAAAGIVMFWRSYRARGWQGWVLPDAIAAELAWALFLWRAYSGFLPWARDAMVVAGAVSPPPRRSTRGCEARARRSRPGTTEPRAVPRPAGVPGPSIRAAGLPDVSQIRQELPLTR
jgi:hypothetical protein